MKWYRVNNAERDCLFQRLTVSAEKVTIASGKRSWWPRTRWWRRRPEKVEKKLGEEMRGRELLCSSVTSVKYGDMSCCENRSYQLSLMVDIWNITWLRQYLITFFVKHCVRIHDSWHFQGILELPCRPAKDVLITLIRPSHGYRLVVEMSLSRDFW